MIRRVSKFIEENRLLTSGQTVFVGFSGGPDSTALLHILKELGYFVIAAHVNHGQRTEADEHELRCKEIADRFGVGWVAAKYDVPGMAREHRIGLEEAGRKARYDFFRQLHIERGHPTATAHTLDDGVETMILNLARGTGLKGLSGIPLRREDFIIRPLLEVRRTETEAYCQRIGITPLRDPTNEDKRFARARLREFMPAFESLHPGAILNASRSAKIFLEADEFLVSVAAKAMHECEVARDDPLAFLVNGFEVALDADRMRHLPKAVVNRGVRLIADALGSKLTFDQVEIIHQLARHGQKGCVTSEGGCMTVEVRGDRLCFRRHAPRISGRIPIEIPGEVNEPALGFRFAVCVTEEPPERPLRSLSVVVDADALVGGLHVRALEPGDRIHPFNGPKEKKIAELLTDRKVSAFVRSRLPIVCDAAGPVWVPSVCIADRVKVTSETRQRYRLELGAPV